MKYNLNSEQLRLVCVNLSDEIKKGDKLLSYKLDDMEPYTKSVDVLSWFSEEDTGIFSEWSEYLFAKTST